MNEVLFPLYVFEKDDSSMFRVEHPDRLLYHMETTDIEDEEYYFWDRDGRPVRISAGDGKIRAIEYCEGAMSLQGAFERYTESRDISADTSGNPSDSWNRIEDAISRLPRRRGFLSGLFKRR